MPYASKQQTCVRDSRKSCGRTKSQAKRSDNSGATKKIFKAAVSFQGAPSVFQKQIVKWQRTQQ